MNTILLLSMALLSDPEGRSTHSRRMRVDPNAAPPVAFRVRRPPILPGWLESFLPPRLRHTIRETEDTRESIGAMIRGPIPLPHVWLQHEHYLGHGLVLRIGVGLTGPRPSVPVELIWHPLEDVSHSLGLDLARMSWLRGHSTHF